MAYCHRGQGTHLVWVQPWLAGVGRWKDRPDSLPMLGSSVPEVLDLLPLDTNLGHCFNPYLEMNL